MTMMILMRGAGYLLLMLLMSSTELMATATSRPREGERQETSPPDEQRSLLRGYSLKPRPRRKTVETMMLRLDQLNELGPLSFSEDTAPMELENFILVLYETNKGDLPVSPSMETMQTAFEMFLQAELNSYFNRNHQVDTVQAAVAQQTATATRKGGATISGTEIEMAVDVLFTYRPTPKYEELEVAIQTILMGDLSGLVANVTALADVTADEFLQEVHTIEYRGQIPILNPPEQGAEENNDGDTTNNATSTGIVTTEQQSKAFFGSVLFFVPALLALALVFIGMIICVVQRKRKARTDDSSQQRQQDSLSKLPAPLSEIASNDGTGLNLYYDDNSPSNDEQNDAFSLNGTDGMVEDIPLTPPSYRKATAAVPDDSQSDIFSGIGAVASNLSRKSPRNHNISDSRSVFSFLSNLGSKSTVVASNVTTTPSNKDSSNSPANSSVARRHGTASSRSGSGTPKSRISSLFTFSEEESEDNANETTKADSKVAVAATPSSGELSTPFDEVEISISDSVDEPAVITTTTTESPKRKPSPLAAMAAGALSFVTGRGSANSSGGGTSPGNKKISSKAMMTTRAPEPNSPAPDDEMTSLTTDDIARDIKKAEAQFLMIKQATGLPPDTKEEPSQSQKKKASMFDNECGPSACGPDYPVATAASSTSSEAYASKRNRSTSPRRHNKELSPRSSLDGSLEVVDPTTPLLKSAGPKINLTIDTGNGKGKTTSASLADPSPSAKSYTAPTFAISSPAISDKSSKTDPGLKAQRSAPSSSEGKNFMKLFFSSPKKAAAKKAFAATMDDESALLMPDEARDEGESNKTKGRRSMGSPGLKDGTGDYQHLTSEHRSPASSTNNSLSFIRGSGKVMAPTERMKFEGSLQDTDEEWISPSGRVRKHTKSTAADGTSNYQNQYMRQYSTEGLDAADDPTLDDSFNGAASRKRRMMQIRADQLDAGLAPMENNGIEGLTPKSQGTNFSSVSGLSGNSPVTTKSPESSGKQLINDLIWLEQKIAGPKHSATKQRGLPILPGNNDMIEQNDSLSFASADDKVSTVPSTSDRNHSAVEQVDNELPEVIVCRDCIAPPGKLKIVIHSTKDGPAVHTVKKGSVLTGHMFPGDLIISVDNVDTRSYSAEQVMKLMTAKSRQQRKITVLHIESHTLC
jgi:hypothetical protein